jgi:hypothetical protein
VNCKVYPDRNASLLRALVLEIGIPLPEVSLFVRKMFNIRIMTSVKMQAIVVFLYFHCNL